MRRSEKVAGVLGFREAVVGENGCKDLVKYLRERDPKTRKGSRRSQVRLLQRRSVFALMEASFPQGGRK